MKGLKASKQTRLKMKNGFHKAPISYKVLMIHQFNKDDQKEIARGLALAISPKEAMKLLPRPGYQSKWTLQMVTLFGNSNCQVLKFKGLEVAVYWQRQLSEVIPDPSDPVPEGRLENPDDVWARLDLFHKSARQLVGVVGDDLKTLNAQIISKDVQIAALNRIKQADDNTIATLQGTISSLQAQLSKKKK